MNHALAKSLTAIMALIVYLGFAGTAYADDDPGKVSLDSSSMHTNERSSVVTLDAKRSGSAASPNSTGHDGQINGFHAITIRPPGGRSGTFAQGFNSHYSSHCGWFTCNINVSSGSSYARWLGSTPYNAKSIGLTDRVWVGGVNVSISVGSSPSAGVSISENKVTMSSSVRNHWRNEHSFGNINFSTHVSMWGPYQNSSDSATFSYRTFYDNIT